MPDSECYSVVVHARSSLVKEYPIYSMPDKTTKNQVGDRSGIEEESYYRRPFDCITSSTSSDATTVVASPACAPRRELERFASTVVASSAYGELDRLEGGPASGVSVVKEGRLYHYSHLVREHKCGQVDMTIKRRHSLGRRHLGILPDVKGRSRVYVGKCRRVSGKELKIISGVSLSNSASPDVLLSRKSCSNCQFTEV